MAKIEDILNDKEKKQIQNFLANTNMKEAVKKILLASIYSNGTIKPGEDPDYLRNHFLGLLLEPRTGQEYNLTNEQLGAKFRARIEAVILLDDGFKQLDKFEIINIEIPEKKNPGK
jgi:hypothetical protein